MRGEHTALCVKVITFTAKVNPFLRSASKHICVKLLTLSQVPPIVTFERTVILGSGVAGTAAAINCSSTPQGVKPLVILGPEPVGQLRSAVVMRNWPGVMQPTTGLDLLTELYANALRNGVRFLPASVEFVSTEMWPYCIFTQSGHIIVANSVILATGRHRNGLNLPGEASLIDRGGVYLKSPTSPYLFEGKTVVVVGTSRTAA